MLLVFPIFAFLLFFLIFRRLHFEWRKSVLAAAVFWGTSVTLITEILSLPRFITPQAVAEMWIAICAAALFYLMAYSRHAGFSSSHEAVSDPPAQHPDLEIKVALVLSAIIVALVGATAILAPPSSSDARKLKCFFRSRAVMLDVASAVGSGRLEAPATADASIRAASTRRASARLDE